MAFEDSVDMGDVRDALQDITNEPTTTLPKNEDAHALAREKGWAEPQGFDYMMYNAEGKARQEAEEAQGLDWQHSQPKYEWQEDYGEVGPAVPELEQILFRSEFLNRRGIKFDE